MKITRGERKAWARERFHGYENLLIPSFSRDLRELDEAGVRLDVRQSIDHGFFSMHCALEAGLTPAEQERLLAAAVAEASDRISVSFPLCCDSLEQNLELLQRAQCIGASHAYVTFPQSFAPRSEEDIVRYVRELAGSTELGLCLVANEKTAFNHLHPSGAPLEAYERLAELDNVVALQLGAMDAGLILECYERFGERLLVATTNLGLLPMLTQEFIVRWSGPWTVEGLQSPRQQNAVRFFDHLHRRELPEAMALYWKAAPALGVIARVLTPLAASGAAHWPMLKYQQWLSGGNGGMTRQPCMRMFERDMAAMRGALRAVGVECADADDAFFVGRTAIEARRA